MKNDVSYFDLRNLERLILSVIESSARFITISMVSEKMDWSADKATEVTCEFMRETKFLIPDFMCKCRVCDSYTSVGSHNSSGVYASSGGVFKMEVVCEFCGDEFTVTTDRVYTVFKILCSKDHLT
jgi:hypothetical protein